MSACDRACLESFLDRYLAALGRSQVAQLPIARTVFATENNREVRVLDGKPTRTMSIRPTYAIRAADVRTGNIGYLGIADIGGKAVPYSVRLKVSHGLITEIETILPESSLPAAFYEQTAKQVAPRPTFRETVPPAERESRDEMILIANAHYEGLEQADSRPVPFVPGCHRIENGVALTNNPGFAYPVAAKDGRALPDFGALDCKGLAQSGIFDADLINARRFPIVDEERGLVFAYAFYQPFAKAPCATTENYGEVCPTNGPGTFKVTSVMVEVFKITGGQIQAMESVWDIQPQTWRSVWWRSNPPQLPAKFGSNE